MGNASKKAVENAISDTGVDGGEENCRIQQGDLPGLDESVKGQRAGGEVLLLDFRLGFEHVVARGFSKTLGTS